MLRYPEHTHLFLVEIGGEKYGAEDFKVREVRPLKQGKGFESVLHLPEHNLTERYRVALTGHEGRIQLDMDVENESDKEVAFKCAFPQIGGLALSKNPDD